MIELIPELLAAASNADRYRAMAHQIALSLSANEGPTAVKMFFDQVLVEALRRGIKLPA